MNTPSWQKWPPNCCETCTGPWESSSAFGGWEGTCGKASSVNYGDKTDARFRCQDFERKADAQPRRS
jgi:hypothetical protein